MAELTSITLAKLNSFRKTAVNGDQLGCEKIAGFHFKKQNKGGAWRLRYTDLTGKRRTATIADDVVKPQQAAETAMLWRTRLKEGKDPLTVKEQEANKQIAEQQAKEANRYLNTGAFFEAIYTPYKQDNFRAGSDTLKGIKRNFSHLFSRDMDKITSADILAWYNKRRKKGVMRSTLVRDYGAFKAMLNYAAQSPDTNTLPVLSNNPIKSYSLPQLTINEQEKQEKHQEQLEAKRDIISEQDKANIEKGLTLYGEQLKQQRARSIKHGKKHLASLDNVTYPHWFIPFCHIARLTGMRPADIYGLKWENLHHNIFNGTTTLNFIPSKTKKAENSKKVKFPVTGELKAVLTVWGEQLGQPEKGFIFTSERTGSKLERKAHLTHWKQVKSLGGITSDLDLYSFRHNFISTLVAKGVPVLTIAALVGHKDGSMIAANYLRHNEQDTASILESINTNWDSNQIKEFTNA